jgi:putrescine transport system substrate-binding protein
MGAYQDRVTRLAIIDNASIPEGWIMRRTAPLTGLLVLVLVVGCGKHGSESQSAQRSANGTDEKSVNLYIWADYLAPDTLAAFEKQTGITVRVSYFDNLETLESRMLTGHSGFDVVVPTGVFIQRQIRSGAYLALDKTKLSNFINLDPAILAQVAVYDPGNTHGIPYMWGTAGIGYNERMLAQILPGVPRDSSRLLFDPAFAAKLSKCGINIMDDPVGVVRVVLKYLGKNPNEPTPQDLSEVETVLSKIRPYVRNIDTSGDIEAMANGDICIALAYNGDAVQARKRAKEAKNGVEVDFAIPKEGTFLWFDMLAIPTDAPHLANAYLLVDYLLKPRVIADISNVIGFANANSAATPLLDAKISADTIIYPTPDQKQRLFVPMEPSPEQTRAITRLWQKFKTGQ